MDELFIPRNSIDVAQELQWGIATAKDDAVQLTQDALSLLGDVREIHDSQRLIIHALSGYVLNRKLTFEEQLLQHQFDELTLIGYFGGLPFIEKIENPRIQSFMVDMYDVRIISPFNASNRGGRITPPILIPVLDVQTVLVAP